MKKAMLAAALAASFAAAVPAAFPVGDAAGFGAPVCEAHETRRHENQGLKLSIPADYDNLVFTKVFQGDEDGRLFSVSEAASMAEALSRHERGEGAGWLFSIGRVDASRLHKMLCGDMSGAEVFAKDGNGNYYIFYHPTDVRYMRADADAMRRDAGQWTTLNAWARREVPPTFIEENGLAVETYDNSAVAMDLARAAYKRGTRYTVGTMQHGALASDEVEAAPYVERLIRGATYRMADLSEMPDGEYVALYFPDTKVRYDFFKMQGKENYIREVHADGATLLYEASFADPATKASRVMQQWYNALAAAR